MLHAQLISADMRGAHLGSSHLQDADLEGTNLEGADLQSSNLTAANFGGAIITHADFRITKGLTSSQILECKNWQIAFFDLDMLKQLGLPPDHNEKLEQQMCDDSTDVVDKNTSSICKIYRDRSRTSTLKKSEQRAKSAAATPSAPK
jgi:hypothetical protein